MCFTLARKFLPFYFCGFTFYIQNNAMQNTPQLIIFDCDGVLVDSEPLSNQIIAEEITKLGYPMTTMEAFNVFAGGSLEIVSAFIKEKIGGEVPDNLEAIYRKRSYELFEEKLAAVAGIEDALKTLTIPRCVGSNGPLDKIKFNLGLTNLSKHFDEQHLFSAYEVNRWKPDPFLYLHAAKEMGVAPEHCVVVEDSFHGTQAGVAAGMRVLGYSPHNSGEKLKKAGAQVFDSMSQLIDLIYN